MTTEEYIKQRNYLLEQHRFAEVEELDDDFNRQQEK